MVGTEAIARLRDEREKVDVFDGLDLLDESMSDACPHQNVEEYVGGREDLGWLAHCQEK
jgi:hypothetical protein